jgi:hypothetical protein
VSGKRGWITSPWTFVHNFIVSGDAGAELTFSFMSLSLSERNLFPAPLLSPLAFHHALLQQVFNRIIPYLTRNRGSAHGAWPISLKYMLLFSDTFATVTVALDTLNHWWLEVVGTDKSDQAIVEIIFRAWTFNPK